MNSQSTTAIIYGLDFTSAPRPSKPITCARCTFDGATLRLAAVEAFTDFEGFEGFLRRPGPWLAGLDFPFGQPAELVRNLDWGTTWEDYVSQFVWMSKPYFVHVLTAYREERPPGHKHHLRRTDKRAGSVSPMMLYGVPVGKMFFEGAPRLLVSGVQIVPCHPRASDRVAVEAYPALVARKWIGRQSYKNDTRRKQTPDQRTARAAILNGLRREGRESYGFELALDDEQAGSLLDDPTGDRLDALLCAVQAAWAHTQPYYGIPPDCDPLEGWIVDPATRTPLQ